MNKKNEKKMKNEEILILSCIFILLISLAQVNALGIAPSKKIIDYNNDEIPVTIRITNNDGKNLTLKISASGDLSKYIIIDEDIIRFNDATTEKQVTYKLKLPSGLDPKKNSANIVLTEVSEGINQNVGGLLSLTHQLLVNIPYSEKYIDGELQVLVNSKKVLINLSILNLGSQKINNIEGKLLITDIEGNIIVQRNIDSFANFQTSELKKIQDSIEIENPGEYTVTYKLNYDDNSNFEVSKLFKIGEYNIEIQEAEVKNFKLGTIAKFDISLINYWNNEIDEVYTEVIITDLENKTVGRFVSDKESINPDNDYLTAYWDTSQITSGVYNMKVIIYAGENSFVKEYLINVESESITLENEKNSDKKNRLLLGIILIILSLLIFSIIIRYEKRKLYK